MQKAARVPVKVDALGAVACSGSPAAQGRLGWEGDLRAQFRVKVTLGAVEQVSVFLSELADG